jgi:transcriptional regulator with GAF, ATPase, and Fis domain
MRATGVVAWVNDLAEAGIEFVKLSQSQARRLREWCSENQIASAAQELMGVAGGWPAALELIAELARTVTGAGGASITLSGRGRACCSVEEKLPVRATLAAPIYEGEQAVGQLEVYAVDFGAFDEADLRALSMLAALLSEMVQRRAAPKPEVAPKPPLATRIADRMEGIWPRTVRVRVVLRIGNPSLLEMTKIRSATSSTGK